MEEKKVCPLLGKTCLEDKCVWYFGKEGTDPAECAIKRIATRLYMINNKLPIKA